MSAGLALQPCGSRQRRVWTMECENEMKEYFLIETIWQTGFVSSRDPSNLGIASGQAVVISWHQKFHLQDSKITGTINHRSILIRY